MTMEKTATSGHPRTLIQQAHEDLVRIRPNRDASLQAWLFYYERSAALYDRIADTDPSHKLEAQYWAQRERDHARGIAARMRTASSTRRRRK
jgi:TorA maturation chaperone TorD